MVVTNKTKNGNFATGILEFNCLPRGFWALISLVDHKGTHSGRLGA